MIAKKNKIFIILIILIAIIFCIGTKVYAGGITDGIEDANNIKSWNFNPSVGNLSTPDSKVMTGAAWVINLIKTASIFIAVISLIILGLQTILGSVEEKAVNKKKITTLVVGVLFMSSVTAIVSVIFENIAKV